MIEKIPPGRPPGYTSDASSVRGKSGVEQDKPHEGVRHSAEVTLSDEALALQRIMQAVNDAPDVRDDVVQRIRAEIDAGTYRVDAEALAERLLRMLR